MLQKLLRLKLSYTISVASFLLGFSVSETIVLTISISSFPVTVSVHFIGLYSRTMLKIMMTYLKLLLTKMGMQQYFTMKALI